MTSRTLAVVSAGLSQPSSTSLLAERRATATTAALVDRAIDVEVSTIELRGHAHDLTDNLLTFFASESLQEAKDVVTGADGVLAVTPVFSASYNGLFKTFFDLLDDGALTGTPVLLGATAGTARHSLALEHAVRPLFSYLRALNHADRSLRRLRGLGRRRRGRWWPRLPDRPGRSRVRSTGRRPREGAAADPFAASTPFEQVLNAS